MKSNIKNLAIFIFFLLITSLLLKDIIFSSGLIIGEDCSPPATNVQIKKVFESGLFTWDFNNFIAFRSFNTGAALIYQCTEYLLSLLGISGEIFIKIFVVFVMAFAGFSMYVLLKHLKIKQLVAVYGGVFYITTPLFFNYLIMGWHFVLLAMGLLPIALIFFNKAVKNNDMCYAVKCSLIFALSLIQSQSLVWFPIVFLCFSCYLITDKKSVFIYFKIFFIILLLSLMLNLHVILGLLLFPMRVVAGSEYINAPASLGMMVHFYPINILRLWGALFNYQYETIIDKFGLSFISFVFPLAAACSLFFKKEKRLVTSLWMIALAPLFMYYLNFYRYLLLHLPFANLIRDFPRFSVLSVFAYSILIAIFLNKLIFTVRDEY